MLSVSVIKMEHKVYQNRVEINKLQEDVGYMTYNNVLVPLDCSRLAESVLPYAISLATVFGFNITLYHACSPESCQSFEMHRDYLNRKVEIIKRQLSQFGGKDSNKLGIRAREVQSRLGIGYPAEEIIRYSNDNNISLVLISRHGQSGMRQWMVGSTAEKVIYASRVPVWLVQVPFPNINFDVQCSVGTILVLLDGSEKAESILPYVEALAVQQTGKLPEIILFTVFDPKTTSNFPNYNAAQDYLTGLEKRFDGTGLNVSFVVREGKPELEIIDYANSKLTQVDLVSMTTHGESTQNDYGLGSVAEKVISKVSIPILVVRPD